MSKQSKVKQMYDVTDKEIKFIRRFYLNLLNESENYGFMEIETEPLELKERYLNATKVHFSKMFEVMRAKEKSKYILQSDLAMSMSRYVADIPEKSSIMKLIQLGELYRDRIDKLPGYRKNFKQILLGVWGSKSLYVDSELIAITFKNLDSIKEIKNKYIVISNHNIYDAIEKGLSSRIKFFGIECIKENCRISQEDKKILYKMYRKERISIESMKEFKQEITSNEIRCEIEKCIEIYNYLMNLFQIKEIFFSTSLLGGTGHYSGMNYRIYGTIQNMKLLIADGGRIDDLVEKFSKNNKKSGTCIGIGVQVLAQFLSKKDISSNILLFLDEKEKVTLDQIEEIAKCLNLNSNRFILLPTNLKKLNIKFSLEYNGIANYIVCKNKRLYCYIDNEKVNKNL